jgi:hypothetical protein
MSTCNLRAEAIQDGPKIAINIDSIAEIGVHFRFGSTDSPYYTLMELGNFEFEEFLEEEEDYVI